MSSSGSREYRAWVNGLANEIHSARLRRGLSQESVAEAAGISLNTYARLERGGTGPLPNPTLHTVMRVFSALGLQAHPPTAR
jgi:transcriptional regulator with XRE-family HTH domain